MNAPTRTAPAPDLIPLVAARLPATASVWEVAAETVYPAIAEITTLQVDVRAPDGKAAAARTAAAVKDDLLAWQWEPDSPAARVIVSGPRWEPDPTGTPRYVLSPTITTRRK